MKSIYLLFHALLSLLLFGAVISQKESEEINQDNNYRRNKDSEICGEPMDYNPETGILITCNARERNDTNPLFKNFFSIEAENFIFDNVKIRCKPERSSL